MFLSLRCGLASHLLDLNDDELGGLQWSKANQDVHDSVVLVSRGGGLAVALHEICLTRCGALKCTLTEQRLHEGAEVKANLRPQWFVVRLKHHPLGTSIQAFFQEQSETANRHIFVFIAGGV